VAWAERTFILIKQFVIHWKSKDNSSVSKYRHVEVRAILFFVVVHLFTCAYIVWVISLPCLPSPLPSSVSGRSHSALVTDFVEEKT
jgi:hypothetical protein